MPGFRKKAPIRGRLERIDRGIVYGWAFDASAPTRRIEVDIKIDDVIAVTCTANRPRGDLARAGIGDGAHGFEAKLPADRLDGRAHRISATEHGTGSPLPSSLSEATLAGGSQAKTAKARKAEAAAPSRLTTFIPAAPSEASEASEAAEDDDSGDAVANGRFTHWSGAFRRTLDERAVELADGWFLESKKPNPKVSAWLTEVITRDLLAGAEGALTYGTALFGELSGRYVRLLTTLDARSLGTQSPKRLTFFARPASANQRHPTLTAPPVTTIASISIVQRVEGAEDRRLSFIAKKVKVPPAGKVFEFDLTREQLAALQENAETGDAAGRRLLLVFEFTMLDCIIADVSLTAASEEEESPELLAQRVRLEDESIIAQIPMMRGVEHWLSPEPLAVPTAKHGGRGSSVAETAKWRWPDKRGRSLDIVICVHDAAEETLDCLDSVKRCTTIPHIVTLVDDGSNGSTRAQLRSYAQGAPWIRLIELKSQMGYTKAANAGLSSASADWVVLLNSDTIVTPGWIEGFFDVVAARPEVSFVGPLSNAASWQSVPDIRDSASQWKVNAIPDGMTIDDVAALVKELSPRKFPEVPLLNGFCTMMRRTAIEELGFLDEVNFPQGYGEENDLCLRARKAGHRLALADHVYVYHVKSASFGSRRRDQLSKQGTERLLAKHPDADMQKLQEEMAELGTLMELRKGLRMRLSQRSQAARTELVT